MNKTKTPIGLLDLGFAQVATEPANAHPTYNAAVSLGHSVRAALTVTTAQLRVYGDDALQISDDSFVSGSLETQTLMTDLELEGLLYGADYDENTGLTDSVDDASVPGAVYYIQKLMKKDKSLIYRAVVLYRCSANRSNYGNEADTKKDNIESKTGNVTFDVLPDNTGAWRWRQDYTSEAAAMAGINTALGLTSGGTGNS